MLKHTSEFFYVIRLNNIQLCAYAFFLCIHLSVDTWLQFLAILNSAVMNTHVQIPVFNYFVYILRHRIAVSFGNSSFWCFERKKYFLHSGHTVCNNSTQLHPILANTGYFWIYLLLVLCLFVLILAILKYIRWNSLWFSTFLLSKLILFLKKAFILFGRDIYINGTSLHLFNGSQ